MTDSSAVLRGWLAAVTAVLLLTLGLHLASTFTGPAGTAAQRASDRLRALENVFKEIGCLNI